MLAAGFNDRCKRGDAQIKNKYWPRELLSVIDLVDVLAPGHKIEAVGHEHTCLTGCSVTNQRYNLQLASVAHLMAVPKQRDNFICLYCRHMQTAASVTARLFIAVQSEALHVTFFNLWEAKTYDYNVADWFVAGLESMITAAQGGHHEPDLLKLPIVANTLHDDRALRSPTRATRRNLQTGALSLPS